MKKILLLSLLFLPFLASNAFAQGTKMKRKKPIEYVIKNTLRYIEFYDTATQLLISRFDVCKNNPYNDLGFEIARKDIDCYNYYKIPNGHQLDTSYYLSPDLPWANARNMRYYDTEKVVDRTPAYISSYASYSANDTIQYVAVAYTMKTQNAAGAFIGFHSTIFILSKNGEIVKSIDHIDMHVEGIAITQPASYLFLSAYCGFGENGERDCSPSFIILDLKTNNIVYSEKTVGSNTPVAFDRNKFLIFSDDETDYVRQIKIIDMEAHVVYERVISAEQSVKKVNKDGSIVLIDTNGNTSILPFDSYKKRNY